MAGIIIGAPGSGSGKTMITCGLLTLLKRKGLNPAAFKCGPDYIDGLFHRRILGVDSGNLDSFFETEDHMRGKICCSMQEHFVVAEGVMGYYDGLGGASTRGSSYEIADILDLPAILVVDAKGASVSLCALIKGFLEYNPAGGSCEKKTHEEKEDDRGRLCEETNEKKTPEEKTHIRGLGHNHISGIFFNRMSTGLFPIMRDLVEEQLHVPVIGYLPELPFLNVGSRHLGLVLPEEIDGLREQMEQLADQLDQCLDWEQFLRIAGWADRKTGRGRPENAGQIKAGPENAEGAGSMFRLGIARDEAFCFYYNDNLEAMRRAGARLVSFSPIHDSKLPEGLSGIILGGGYPENHGAALSGNASMRASVAAAAADGMPVLAECGGYLYLLDSLECTDGSTYPMAGVFTGHGYRAGKTGRFGYITLSAREELPFLHKGKPVKGHEFHYWDCRCDETELRMKAVKPRGNRTWPCMRTVNRVMAGFPHLYYPSCPELVRAFADQCMIYGKEHGL